MVMQWMRVQALVGLGEAAAAYWDAIAARLEDKNYDVQCAAIKVSGTVVLPYAPVLSISRQHRHPCALKLCPAAAAVCSADVVCGGGRGLGGMMVVGGRMSELL